MRSLSLTLTATLMVTSFGLASARSSFVDGELTPRVRSLVEQAGTGKIPEPELASRVRSLGKGAPALLFSVLSTGAWPSGGELSEAQETSALHALAALGRSELRGLLERGAVADEQSRGCVLRLLEVVGSGNDLELAVAAADAGTSTDALLAGLERAAQSILERDVHAARKLRGPLFESPGEIGNTLIRALAASEHAQALDLLIAFLGLQRSLDATILQELPHLIERSPSTLERDVAWSIADFLIDDDLSIRRAAARAAGATLRHELAEPLVELLQDPARAVRESAHWSLQELANLRLPADYGRWRRWLDEETSWFESAGQGALDALQSIRDADVVSAVSELAAHPLRRLELAAEIERVLDHENAGVRRLACQALCQFGIAQQPLLLVDRLDDEDEQVARAAYAALRAASGLDLKPSPDAWRDALTGSKTR